MEFIWIVAIVLFISCILADDEPKPPKPKKPKGHSNVYGFGGRYRRSFKRRF